MSTAGRRVRLRPLALPNEHGAWGFLLEPVLLGLLLAPSWAGAALAGAGLAGLLAQHPLSLALADLRRGQRFPRTAWCWRFAALYGVPGLALLLAAALLAPSAVFLLPLALAAPLVLLQLGYDVRKRSRELLPESAGAVAINALVATMALLAGWTLWPALALWAALALRSVPSIMYVRRRLRLDRGKPGGATWPLLAHVLALGAVLTLAAGGLLPPLAPVAFGVLALRALWGLSRWRGHLQAKHVGFIELGLGVLLVLWLWLAVLLAAGS